MILHQAAVEIGWIGNILDADFMPSWDITSAVNVMSKSTYRLLPNFLKSLSSPQIIDTSSMPKEFIKNKLSSKLRVKLVDSGALKIFDSINISLF